MHQLSPYSLLAGTVRRLFVVAAALGLGLTGVSAQTVTGSISGHVSNAAKTALPGARVSVAGTNLETFTNSQGDYHLANVASGTATINVAFEGYAAAALPATIVGGQTARLDAMLTDEVVTMSAFKITDAVIGTARAINQQRAAPALTNIVASDAIGQLPDKNVAESLQRVPGVDIARDKGEGRYINIRGLDPVYVGVSMNGFRMSTAEKGTRSEALDVMSATFIGSLVVNKVNTPDMDTDDLGGSVDIRTRSGFDQEGEQIMVQTGTNYAHQEDRHGGYNFATNYANQFDGGNLGFALDLAAEARPFTSFTEPGTTWSLVTSPSDGQKHWILASQDFRHYDAKRWRQGISTGLDFKISDTTKAYVRFLDSNYTEKNQQWLTTFPFGAGTVQALTNTSATVSIKAGGIIKSEAQIVNNKRVSSLVSGADTTIGPWTNNLAAGYTTGKYTRPTLTVAFANTAATVVTYNFDAPYNNTVAQVSGPSLDSPASYAFSTKSGYSNTTANMHEITGKDSLRYDLPDAAFPTYVKVGLEYRSKNNNIDTSKWAITAVPYTLAQIAYPGNDIQDTAGGFPNFQIRQEAVQQFYTNQSAFPTTLTASTTYGGAFKDLENIFAGYAMGGVTIEKLKLMAGLRFENTDFNNLGWQVDSTTGAITPDAATYNYTNVLPGVVAEYEFSPQTIARLSWTNTIARPDYSGTAPGRTVDDVNHLVTQGNARLKALTAANYDISIEHYYSPLGLVSLAAFYKSISNFSYQAQSGTDPATGYLLTTYFNGPSAWIYGLEANWVQQLSFLPGPLAGLGLQVNALLGDSQAVYPTRPRETLPFVGFAHEEGNVALTYSYMGFAARIAQHFHSRRLESGSVIGADPTQDQYEEPYRTLDASLSYTFKHHWQIYALGSNLNNAPLLEYYGGTGALHRIQTFEAYGWSAESGLRWDY
jgi:TonB-dependent receptor